MLALTFADDEEAMEARLRAHSGPMDVRRAEAPEWLVLPLNAYFQGDLDALDILKVAPRGTEFQLKVWSELRRLRPGTTATYGEIAERIGRSGASRAVGQANGANPVAIVIPCHRVIAANSGLGGYSSGLHRKRWLLTHEGVLPTGQQPV